MMLVVTFVGVLHPPLFHRVHGRRRGLQPLLRLHEPVRRLDARCWCWPTTCCSSILGWEGVGLCSYLLIGFWYQDPANGAAARKAFIVTRVGDTAMAVGLLAAVHEPGHARHSGARCRGPSQQWPVGIGVAIAAAALLLGGAVGKSAQLPLQTWLPDAMAGPTPVSALIHAATMVTAGVYLIARTHRALHAWPRRCRPPWPSSAPPRCCWPAAARSTQWDIKRVLAYSTISQIGYMFLALGVGAWAAAIFHFMTHAFFKALLFLGAGVVILAPPPRAQHVQDGRPADSNCPSRSGRF